MLVNDISTAQYQGSLLQMRFRDMTMIEKLQAFLVTCKSDFPQALEMLSEDVVWINKLPEHIPFNGKFNGREGVAQYFQLLNESFVLGEHSFAEYDFIEAEDTLVVTGCEKNGQVISTQKVFDLDFVWIVRFNEHGQIKYLREHNDTAAIGAAFLP